MGRLILLLIRILLEGTTLVMVALWGLPKLGIRLPLAILMASMAAWLAYSVIVYRASSRALKKRELIGLPDMVGSQGEVVSPLTPEGLVRIKGELWLAKSIGSEIKPGEEAVVVAQDGLKLVVSKAKQSFSGFKHAIY